MADKLRLRQVIDNLLSNAVKHSPEGSTVIILADDRQQEHWTLEVQDQGDGVPESFAKRIFEQFSQANQDDNSRRSGAGLGLAIAKELSRLMNGDIGYFNQNGAHFWVRLPKAHSNATETFRGEK